jgi:5-formyltetrahydrofolate cyclo-ligase
MREQRRALTDGEIFERSLRAQRHILASGEWAAASSVGLYAAVRRETDTALLADEAWKAGKEVLLPRVSPFSPGIMRLLPYPRGQALVANRFGIPEPEPCPRPPEEDRAPEIVIVPGLAFDGKGRRLGSGGGYYDRLFAGQSMRAAIRIGLAYAFQIVDALPAEAWDAPMHAVATEEGITWP